MVKHVTQGKILLVFCLLFFITNNSAADCEKPTTFIYLEPNVKVRLAEKLNLRSGASTRCSIIGRTNSVAIFSASKVTLEKWFEICTTSQGCGWVSGRYVTILDSFDVAMVEDATKQLAEMKAKKAKEEKRKKQEAERKRVIEEQARLEEIKRIQREQEEVRIAQEKRKAETERLRLEEKERKAQVCRNIMYGVLVYLVICIGLLFSKTYRRNAQRKWYRIYFTLVDAFGVKSLSWPLIITFSCLMCAFVAYFSVWPKVLFTVFLISAIPAGVLTFIALFPPVIFLTAYFLPGLFYTLVNTMRYKLKHRA